MLSVTTGSAQTGTRPGVKVGLRVYDFSGDAVWPTDADSKTSVAFEVFAEIGEGCGVTIALWYKELCG